MIKFKEKTLTILDENGDTIPFQIEELQAELAECFRNGNLASESSYAEDIILLLDYFFSEEKSGNLYSMQEVNQVVAMLLEEAGFSEIAEIYRKKKNFIEPLYSTSQSSLFDLLQTKTFFPAGKLEKISRKTAEIFLLSNIQEAPLSLIIEMCKYVNISLSSNNAKEVPYVSKSLKRGYYLKASDIKQFLQQSLNWNDEFKFVHVGGISKIHSAVKVYINLMEVPELKELSMPLIELEFAESLYNIGKRLDEICNLIKIKAEELAELKGINLPIYLNFVNTKNFISKYMGAEPSQISKKICRDLTDMVINGMTNKVYRVIFKEKCPFFEKK